MSTIDDWAGRLDLLVNNASIFMRTDCDDLNAIDWSYYFLIPMLKFLFY